MNRQLSIFFALMWLITSCHNGKYAALHVEADEHDLAFGNLASTWDEAMPLGNATIGSLVWQKGDNLRISIDRSDLWDLRQSEELSGEGFSFDWLYQQVMKGDYAPVQKRFDYPYNAYPGPSKIPGAGMELPIQGLGEVDSVRLYQQQAVCEVRWKSGASMQCFVHAQEPLGWFILNGVDTSLNPMLVPPAYNDGNKKGDTQNVSRQSLFKLGYEQGTVGKIGNNKLVYTQPGWGDFSYSVALKWEKQGSQIVGVWSATSSMVSEKASDIVDKAMEQGIGTQYASHSKWWTDFYSQSYINIPDKIIEKQYYNELYKMGSIARKNSYPISLQSIWTADDGKLPPWKGDYHHDLNTQLSYWPFYAGNHLDEGYGYLQTLWNQRGANKEYTKQFFGTEGLNVPGVCTLTGMPMGGWCQYAMGTTVSAWLGQHFYLHWKYSQDRDFLKNRAFPYLKDVATYLEQFTQLKNGVRTLPLSASPEFNDNRMEAWFTEMTNFDRALVRFAFRATAELATELELTNEAKHWHTLEQQLPDYDYDENGGLTIAVGHPYKKSHRHFSHLLAIHPLGLIDKSNGEKDSKIIDASISTLDKYGSDWWTGYSFSWAGNIKARAFDGEGAAKALHDFSSSFCLRSGFHVNGDQSGTGKSKFTYRPFTLEGNMAFASGVQEMLMQSHASAIKIFPAVPKSWENIDFGGLRAMGAFIVDAHKENGKVISVDITAEKGGLLRLENPFDTGYELQNGDKSRIAEKDGIIEIETKVGETLHLVRL
ncbi:MAG: glycosyl hydrolase family 95 catalytic domain-containing protein [Bacteroidales bacterium]